WLWGVEAFRASPTRSRPECRRQSSMQAPCLRSAESLCLTTTSPRSQLMSGRLDTRRRARDLLAARTYIFYLIQIRSVAFGFHVVAMDEPQRGGVDTITQAATISRAVGKDMTQMAVAMS